MNYPNPCDTCTEECSGYHGCARWEMRFRTIWKQFNTYRIRQYRKSERQQTKFCYEHPDVARRYLKNGPCKGCQFEKLCDVPCPQYYRWWDARMAVLKERYGVNEQSNGRNLAR